MMTRAASTHTKPPVGAGLKPASTRNVRDLEPNGRMSAVIAGRDGECLTDCGLVG